MYGSTFTENKLVCLFTYVVLLLSKETQHLFIEKSSKIVGVELPLRTQVGLLNI